MATTVNAQNYTFSHSTAAYVNLSSPTVVSTPYWDDFSVFTVSLPFSFNYYGTNYSTIYVMGGFAGFVYDGAGIFGADEMYTFDNEVIDVTGNSTISTSVSGSAPNRIFKIQTLNGNFSQDNTQQDYMNLQVWLYEGTNVIEFHYGPSSIVNPKSWSLGGFGINGPTVGLYKSYTTFLSLSGDASNPTVSSLVPSNGVNGAPPANMIYRFTPSGVSGLTELLEDNLTEIYPNPTNGSFAISTQSFKDQNITINIKNALGQVVYTEQAAITTSEHTVNSVLPKGVYSVEISTGAKSINKKIVIE